VGDDAIRVRQARRKGIRRRAVQLGWLWVAVPALMLGLAWAMSSDQVPLFYALALAATLSVAGSGQSWKDPDRVRELLPDGERSLLAVPVRSLSATGPGHALRDAFVVVTEGRLLVYGHDRLLDVPTGLLYETDRNGVAIELRDSRTITVPTPTGTLELSARRRHLPSSDRLAAILRTPPHPPRPAQP
jgi:hypothetical protein